MKNRRGSFGLVAAGALLVLALAPSATATQEGRKVILKIDMRGAPQGGNPQGGGGTFTLHLGGASDKGASSYSFFGNPTKGSITLTGAHGELDLRTTSRPSGLSVDGQGLDLWTGTWTITGGTGSYAGAHGVGAYVGIIGPSYRVALHFEGFRN